MSAYALQQSPVLTLIREELALYGLNPADWKIQPLESQKVAASVHLTNRHDTDFKLRANLETAAYGLLKISQLSVTSI